MEIYSAFNPRRARHISLSEYSLTAEDFHLNGLYIEPVDLRSGIKAELGQIFSSLNRLKLNPAIIDQIYEQVRLEVM